MAEHILDGIDIVDLSSGLAGPVATQILAEAGADVVKVERPRGDPLRHLHPAAFATWNRSKRSVVLDLADGGDRGSLDGLLASADVVVHDLRPSGAARLGLDDAGLGERFRRLVVCGVTGYPPNHADAERPGYDLLVQARGGLMDSPGWVGPGALRVADAGAELVRGIAGGGRHTRPAHRQRAHRGGRGGPHQPAGGAAPRAEHVLGACREATTQHC